MHVEDRQRHWPGQHYLIRLRAPDDYTAQRSYSVASDDDDPLVEFLVERLPGGEVSEFLADVAEVGDVLELRGPIGRWFIWDTRTPALCLVGGTGVVPAVAMTRAARRARPHATCSGWSRSGAPRRAAVRRRARAGGRDARLHPAVDGRAARSADRRGGRPSAGGVEVAYVCGSSRFAEFAEALLQECGYPMEGSGSSSSARRADRDYGVPRRARATLRVVCLRTRHGAFSGTRPH